MSEPCINCGAPSECLCDFHIGWPLGGCERDKYGRQHPVCDINRPPHTCDVPLCNACKTYKGFFHISGKPTHWESIDYCPMHAHQNDIGIDPITDEEAEVRRREIRAQYRRKKIVIIGSRP